MNDMRQWLRCAGALVGASPSARRWMSAALCLMLWLRAAGADPPDPVQFARGIRVEMTYGDAVVSRGAMRIRLFHTPLFGFSANADSTQIEFDFNDCWTFGEPEQKTFTLDMLEARLDNAAALKLHRAGHYQEAVPGFQRALRLDPGYLLAGFNLASALNLAGQREKAAAILLPFVARNVAKIYLAALPDPELTPLLDQPSLAALRAHPPGTAVLKTWNTDWIAYSPKHGRLAVLDPHDGLRVFALTPGRLDAVLNLGDRIPQWSGEGSLWREREQVTKAMEKRAKETFARKLPAVNRFLADLGFVEVTRRELGKLDEAPDSFQDVQFSGSGMKLARDDSKLRLIHQGCTIAETEAWHQHRLVKVILLPSLKTVVWRWSRNGGATDCHRQAGTEVLIPSMNAGGTCQNQ